MEIETWIAPPGDRIPNHPHFPVVVYRRVEAVHRGAAAVRALFARHGWGGSWVDGVFDFHHFHSTSHEVLAVVEGTATLELGGPQGEAFERRGRRRAGPARGHRSPPRDGPGRVPRRRRLPGRAGGLRPAARRRPAEVAAARERIAALPAPPEDPVGGDGVPAWHRPAGAG